MWKKQSFNIFPLHIPMNFLPKTGIPSSLKAAAPIHSLSQAPLLPATYKRLLCGLYHKLC